ncbi:MAG: hypothetical protein GXX79_15225 [Actinomycetales bacterium]|nr:hypothetical protein [Actinomycetales bacterium]
MQGGWGVDALVVVATLVGIPLGVAAVRGRAEPFPVGGDSRRFRHPVRAVATHPGTWLAVVIALVYLNQVLLTVYITRVHAGDPGFVARYLPPQWFHLARGPAVDSVAAAFPAPHLLAPTVLRVQSFLELPLGILLYLLVTRWLDPGLYRRLGSGVAVWAGSLSISGVFCWVEWLLPSPWTTGNLWIRAGSTLVTPLAITLLVRAGPADRADGAPRTVSGWVTFLVSAGALGVLVLVVYDTALLYNLAHVDSAAPVAVLALTVLGTARLAARRSRRPSTRAPALGRPGAGMDTLVTGMTWFLGVFFVPAMPVRYGLAVIASRAAVPTVALLIVVAGLGTLREVRRRLDDVTTAGRQVLTWWLVGLAAACGVGALAALTAAAVSAGYPETRILAMALAFLLGATGTCALTDRLRRAAEGRRPETPPLAV